MIPTEVYFIHVIVFTYMYMYSIYFQDINPIENMWAALKHSIQKVHKPQTKEELLQAISSFWATVTPEMCQRYIRHQDKVLPAVVENSGRATGY